MLEDFKWVTNTLAFVVPGFVMSSVISLFVPRRKEDEKAQLLKYFVLTLGSFAVFNLLSWWHALWVVGHTTLSGFGMAVYFVFLPSLLGLILGVSARADWVGHTLGKLGFLTVNALATAWDYQFGNISEGAFLIVTLKDGGQVAGYYGNSSFAGDAQNRDLFLERAI